MRRFIVVAALMLVALAARAQMPFAPDPVLRMRLAQASPDARSWIRGEAARDDAVSDVAGLRILQDVRLAQHGPLRGLSTEEAVRMVFMQLQVDADADVRDILQHAKDTRVVVRPDVRRTPLLDACLAQSNVRYETLGSMSEQDQHWLGSELDRIARLLETLSSVVKHVSAPNSAILDNTK